MRLEGVRDPSSGCVVQHAEFDYTGRILDQNLRYCQMNSCIMGDICVFCSYLSDFGMLSAFIFQ